MLNRRHRRTYDDIFKKPVQAGIKWGDIEALIRNLGGTITEGAGSRVTLDLNGRIQVFHRPHPHKETDKGAVVSMRRFLDDAEVDPDAPDDDEEEDQP